MASLLFVFCIIFSIEYIYAVEDKVKFNRKGMFQTEIPFPLNNGVMGVASIAGFTSRNGRVSSIGGIKFFPPFNHEVTVSANNVYSSKEVANQKKSHSAKENGMQGLGHELLEIYPIEGTFVPSASNVGMPNINAWIYPNDPMIDPIKDFLVKSPIDLYNHQNNEGSWIHKDLLKKFISPSMRYTQPWLYPNLNPFYNF